MMGQGTTIRAVGAYDQSIEAVDLNERQRKPGLSDTDKSVGELDPPNLRVVRFSVHLRDT
jgi:hypothetical protein